MQKGKDIWEAAESGTRTGDTKSAHVMRTYALNQMLAEAETAILTGDAERAAERLYELRSYAERLAELLTPEKQSQPSLGLRRSVDQGPVSALTDRARELRHSQQLRTSFFGRQCKRSGTPSRHSRK